MPWLSIGCSPLVAAVVAFAAQLLQLLSLAVFLQHEAVERHTSGSAATASPTS